MTMEYLHPWPRGDGAILAGNGEARLSAQAGKNKALPTRPGEGSAYFPCRRRGSLGPDGRSPIPPAQVTLVDGGDRSEEHTSEIQSLMLNSDAVLYLKKKN